MNRTMNLDSRGSVGARPVILPALALLTAALLAAPGTAGAQAQTGGTPGEWMTHYQSARTLGLADDPLGVLWNPAGLSVMDQNEVRVEHGRMFGEATLNAAGFAVPGSRLPSLGITVVSMRSGEIQRTNDMNDDLGTFRDAETAYAARLIAQSAVLPASSRPTPSRAIVNPAATLDVR